MFRILAIGGLDPSGGAGVAADLRMVQARGGHPLVLVTALTVQNRWDMFSVHPVEQRVLKESLDVVIADGPLHAVKTGLFGTAEQLCWIAERLKPLTGKVPLIVDPVLSATAGGWSADAAVVDAYVKNLLPLATLATPNLPELQRLLPGDDGTGLLRLGCRAVLVKGGHGTGETIRDVLFTPGGRREFAHPRLHVGPVHGTGCALASAAAAYLAAGEPVESACALAIADVQRGLQATEPSADGLPEPLIIL